jgi:hypothetical protein
VKTDTGTRGAAGTSSSSGGTTTGGPCGGVTAGAGNSSSSGATERPCRTRTSPFSGGTVIVTGCDSETSSSSSLMCATPNSSFIISNHLQKPQYTQIVLFLRERSQRFLRKKRKGGELTNWRGGTSPSRRRQWWRKLDSPDVAMARVRRGAGGRV